MDVRTYWLSLGAIILKRGKQLTEPQFKSSFKLSPYLANVVWDRLIQVEGNIAQAKHFLWTLHLLKTLDPNHSQVASFLNTNYKTMKLHVEKLLHHLLNALPDV